MPEPTWRPSWDDFLTATAAVLNISRGEAAFVADQPLAESALAAPFAGVSDTLAYPTVIAQAAVLVEHLARNHPLPDGNKRVAFLMCGLFCERNGLRWGAEDVELDGSTVELIAAGSLQHEQIAAWVPPRTRPQS